MANNVKPNVNAQEPTGSQWSGVNAGKKLTPEAKNWLKTVKFDSITGCVVTPGNQKKPSCKAPATQFWLWEAIQGTSTSRESGSGTRPTSIGPTNASKHQETPRYSSD